MPKPLANIEHWSGAKILMESSAPELGLATLNIRHDDITISLTLALDELQLQALRDGADKALALIAASK